VGAGEEDGTVEGLPLEAGVGVGAEVEEGDADGVAVEQPATASPRVSASTVPRTSRRPGRVGMGLGVSVGDPLVSSGWVGATA